jgi:flagellar hook-associated protein 2
MDFLKALKLPTFTKLIMAAVQLAGLASGFNWTSFVTQLIQSESEPITALQAQQTTLSNENSNLSTLQSDLQSLQTSVTALADPSQFSQTAATVSNSLWTGSTTSGATPGNHTVAVSSLATASQLEGASGISAPIASSSDVSGVVVSAMNLATPITAGEFTVNGARVSVAITDTLQDVFQKISAATGGAVTASYDSADDEVSLSSSSPIVLNSANDTSNFLDALGLANNGTGAVSSSASLGAPNLSAPLDQADLSTPLTGLASDGTGTLTINGVAISYNPTTDSLNTILSKIDSSAAGVTAAYNSSTNKMTLTNNVTGSLGVSVVDSSGNLGAALGLTTGSNLVLGQNAQFSIDGGPTVTTTSNTIDGSNGGIPGLSLTLGSASTEQVDITQDNSTAQTNIQNFVTAFNNVTSYIDAQTATSVSGSTVTTSPLTGDLNVKSIAEALHTMAFSDVTDSSGATTRLDSLGIDFNGDTNQLEISDPAQLATALQNNGQAVSNFFTNSTDGFAAAFTTLINKDAGSNGTIATEIAAHTQTSQGLNTQISSLQANLATQQTDMTNEFVQMEVTESKLQSELAELNSALGTTSTSTSTSTSSVTNNLATAANDATTGATSATGTTGTTSSSS